MINQFSSIFEIFTGLNLAYAGSKVFRDALDNTILQIGNTISTNHKEKFSKIQSEINVTIAEEHEKGVQEKCKKTDRYFTISIEKIKKSEEWNKNFPIGIKSIFLICSLYSFTLLMLGGYEQFYDNTKTNEFLCFINLTFVCVFLIFIRNLLPEKFDKNIKPLTSVFLFSIPIILYILYLKFCQDTFKLNVYFPDFRISVLISIFISLSAFLFHFLRVYIHRTYFRFQILNVYDKTEQELREFERSIYILKSKNRIKLKTTINIKAIRKIKILLNALRKDSH
jgi:hypothetical protein